MASRTWMTAAMLTVTSTLCIAGPLNPPSGPVAPTPGPEPRIAINATNTPGDADSLFKITQPGSYYLTGNITGVIGKRGIEIAASGVTIDLNGFDLVGVPGMGVFDGVGVTGSTLANIAVINGSVRGWGDEGVDLSGFNGTASRVEGVRARSNGGDGISVGSDSVVLSCLSSFNAGAGIRLGFNCVAAECSASSNTQDGIDGSVVNTISHCTSYSNGVDGIGAGIGSKITDSTAYDNGDEGIAIGSSGSVMGCVVHANGGSGIYLFYGASAINCKSDLNTVHGIEALDRCQIIGNACVRNGAQGTGSGIFVSGNDCRIEGNSCIEATRGIEVDGTGNVIIKNTCTGNSTANWDITANNVCGPIVNRTAPASALILGDAAPSSLGTTDPNANFTH